MHHKENIKVLPCSLRKKLLHSRCVFSAGSLELLLPAACVNTAVSGPSRLYLRKHSPLGVHFHRDSTKESTGFPPAPTLTSFSLIWPLMLPFFLISLWSSSVPWPCGIESTSFSPLTCWQSVFPFFPAVGGVRPGVVEGLFFCEWHY